MKIINRLSIMLAASGLALVMLFGGALSAGAADHPPMSKKGFGDCEVTDTPTIHNLALKEDGVVKWAVPLPTPGAIIGDTPETVSGGYLYCIAAEIANRAGASSIKVRNTTFEAITSGADTDFDYTVWDVIITPERQKILDFSIPYRSFDAVVVALKGSDITAANLKDKRIGMLNGARQAPWVEQHIQPTSQIRAFNNNQDMITALIAGQIDVFIHDTDGGILFAAQNQKNGLVPIARLPIEFSVGAVLQKGSPNTAIVTQIIQDMKADGSLEAIYDKWLYPKWNGFTVQAIPVWDFKD